MGLPSGHGPVENVYKINYIIEKYGKLFVFWSC